MIRRIKRIFRFSVTEATQPKWTKLFNSSSTLQINVERSLKNPPSEQLYLYIKGNYKTFNLKQLLLALSSKDVGGETYKLLILEVIGRIILNQENLDFETIQWLFDDDANQQFGFNPILTNYIILQTYPHFDELTLNQQTEYIGFQIRNSQINADIMIRYFSKLKSDDQEFFDKLSLRKYRELMKCIDLFDKPTELGLEKGYTDKLISEYLKFISDYNRVKGENGRGTFVQFLLRSVPSFMNYEQKQQLKLCYANLLEKLFGFSFQYIQVRPIQSRELSKILINVFEKQDYYLLQHLLPSIVNHYTNLKQYFSSFLIFKHFDYFCPKPIMQDCEVISNYKVKTDSFLPQFRINLIEGFSVKQAFDQFKLYNQNNETMTSIIQTQLEQFYAFYIDDFNTKYLPQLFELKYNRDSFRQMYFEYTQLFMAQKDIQTRFQNIPNNYMDTLNTYIDEQQLQLNQCKFQLIQSIADQDIGLPYKFVNFIGVISSIIIYKANCNFQLIQVFQDPLFAEAITKFGLGPDFLNNLIIIAQYHPRLFSEENLQVLNNLKKQIDDLLNLGNNPQNYIDYVENELEKYNLSKLNLIYLTKSNTVKLFQNCMQSFYQDDSYRDQRIKGYFENNENIFEVNDRNILLFGIVNSQQIIQYTPFKQIIKKSLELDNEEWLMNYSDYPYSADFICKKQKIVIFLDEHPRLIKGIQKIRNQDTTMSQKYFQDQDYLIYYIDYAYYHPNQEELLRIMKQKFVYRFF